MCAADQAQVIRFGGNTFTLWAILPLFTFLNHITPNGTNIKHKLGQNIVQSSRKKGKTENTSEMHFLICVCVSVLHRQPQKLKGKKNLQSKTMQVCEPKYRKGQQILAFSLVSTATQMRTWSFLFTLKQREPGWHGGQQSVYTDTAEPNHTGTLWKSKRGTQYGRERAEEVLRRIQAHTETFQNGASFVSFGKQFRPLVC